MKKLLLPIICISFLSSCGDDKTEKKTIIVKIDSTVVVKTDANKKTKEPPMDSARMMANWAAYMKPSEMHEMLKSWNGTWKQESTTWEYPGAAPQTSKGTMVNEMILGGRYQRSTSTGNMMGVPYQGISTTAYDNAKKTFKMSWIDNVETGMAILEGPWDIASNSMSLAGTMVDPSSADGKEHPVRELYKVEDDKHHTMQMFMPGTDGKEFMMMEIKFTKM